MGITGLLDLASNLSRHLVVTSAVYLIQQVLGPVQRGLHCGSWF